MDKLKSIAFYLPQFHRTPTNDFNWGKGFTEWTNVCLGQPRFAGHDQPRVPGELGFYDLRLSSVFGEQIALAKEHGVDGFCFYYYRFGAKRELETPVQNLLSRPHPIVPFCFCWANESWTRAWDGRSDKVILEQTYDDETLLGLAEDLTQAMSDPRYITIDGKPVFLIYQIEYIPEPRKAWLDRLRAAVKEKLRSDILLGCVYSHGLTKEMTELVDFVVQFPPHRTPRRGKRKLLNAEQIAPFDISRGDFFEGYGDVVQASLEGAEMVDKLVPGVCPDWDNSARRQTKAHTLVGSEPELFSQWVAKAAEIARKKAESKKIPYPLLFVNAWNEWGEGAALEPSWKHKRAYLEAFKAGIASGA